jgi:hypothetical protein
MNEKRKSHQTMVELDHDGKGEKDVIKFSEEYFKNSSKFILMGCSEIKELNFINYLRGYYNLV